MIDQTDLLEDFKDMLCMSLPVIALDLPDEKGLTFYFWDGHSIMCELSTGDDSATVSVDVDRCEVHFPWAWRKHTMLLRQAVHWIEQITGDLDG